MKRPLPHDPIDPGRRATFATTQWSVVLAARDVNAPGAREALESLCASYWYPLYAFVRRKGYDPDRAMDLVQGFFSRMLEKKDLASIDPSKGRFRSFLMAACSNFLANRDDHDRAAKRGGRPPISLDAMAAERRYWAEPAHDLTAERLFLNRVLDRLEQEWLDAGKSSVFAALKPALLGGAEAASYRVLAAQAGITEGAARVAAHRMRARYRKVLREEVARTVADPADVEEEIRDLFTTLSG
jgi:DNA-directed RNA polymerase specialized sigma24 family protein